jgi:transposase-like protein
MSEYISVWAVCREIGYTPATVYKWIRDGFNGVKLKASKQGRTQVVLRSDLNAFLKWRNDGILIADDQPKE